MVKKKQTPEGQKVKASGKKKKPVSPTVNIPKGKRPKSSATRDPSARADQIGALLNKGFDLAEAGIGLGVNIVSRLGSMVQEQVISKIVTGERPGAAGLQTSAENGPLPPEPAVESPGAPEATGISNRMPLFPGSPVSISFSINNDSLSSKKLKLGVENFVGQIHQFKLDSQTFSIHPSDKVIAPMDFDKFTLKGRIPQEAPEDTYHGWILVTGEEKFRIPAALIVTKGV
jgi:hypothetical protein